MTLAQLLASIRNTLDDETGSASEYLWSDADLTQYINEGIELMCEKCPTLIIDSTTSAICSISAIDGTLSYALSPYIIGIERMTTSASTIPLEGKTKREMDLWYSNWTSTEGTPRYWIEDYETGNIALVPVPNANQTISMVVSRIPTNSTVLSTSNTSATPEIPVLYHKNIEPYVCYRAYSKQDTETVDKMKAAEWKQVYEEAWEKMARQELKKFRKSHYVGTHGGTI